MPGGNIMSNREPEYAINPLFIERWSSRAYDKRPIPHEELMSLFEAARWSPSAWNAQPWRFIVGTTEADYTKFEQVIFERNWEWAKDASALVLLYSYTKLENGDRNHFNGFDSGAAAMALALEAEHQGLKVHHMAGIDRDKAREVFAIPADYDIHCAISIGYQGDKAKLAPMFQEREMPNARRSVDTFVTFLSK